MAHEIGILGNPPAAAGPGKKAAPGAIPATAATDETGKAKGGNMPGTIMADSGSMLGEAAGGKNGAALVAVDGSDSVGALLLPRSVVWRAFLLGGGGTSGGKVCCSAAAPWVCCAGPAKRRLPSEAEGSSISTMAWNV
jgi:hypothetical protein